jgi:hypothetical protein
MYVGTEGMQSRYFMRVVLQVRCRPRLVLALDELDEVVHHALVKVLATQVRVAAGRQDLRGGGAGRARARSG